MAAKHPIHSMCGYLGSFPPTLPREALRRWLPQRATVLDPFCGGGTTLVEALLRGSSCVGVDLNPLAVAVSRAKVQPVAIDDVLYRLSVLAREYRGECDLGDVPTGIQTIFHPRTLSQLCYLRAALAAQTPEDQFIQGAILGILHGKVRRDGTTAYLSIDMPNTFSMSPNYVRKFVARNGLTQQPVDAFGQVRKRVHWLLREGSVANGHRAQVVEGDATQLGRILSRLHIGTVGGIVTSPPYLGVLRYGAFNWIRLWFLGHEPDAVDRRLDDTDSLDRYLSFMASFLDAAAGVLRVGSPVVLVVGDVVEGGQHVKLAERLWAELGGVVPFQLESIEVDDFGEAAKTTRIWGEAKRGRATPLDRLLVIRRASKRPRKAAKVRRLPRRSRASVGRGG